MAKLPPLSLHGQSSSTYISHDLVDMKSDSEDQYVHISWFLWCHVQCQSKQIKDNDNDKDTDNDNDNDEITNIH